MTDLFGNPDPVPGGHGGAHGAGSVAGGGVGSISGGSLQHGRAVPLAVRMRPRTVDEIVGQQHLLGPGSALRRLAEGNATMSVFLWGPPGVGKTTIASVISQSTNRRFVELSAVTAGVKEVRAEIETARRELAHGRQSVLFVDEVHRFSKSQQDVLLPAVENRIVTLIAATTENPSFSVIAPLLSRSLLLTLKPLTDDDLASLVDRALTSEQGLGSPDGPVFTLEPEAREALIRLSGGDARRVLTFLEETASAAEERGLTTIDTELVEASIDRAAVRYDKDGDQHHDVISAFIKSIRGSDVDAAVHYLARMLEAGEDPRFIARRLVILASEDIGMAAPSVLGTCVAAAQAVQLIGMPEARLNLAQATIAAALAPKSNAVITAIDAALADVASGRIGEVPPHLRDAHYQSAAKLGHGVGYQYPHNLPGGVAKQQYLPDALKDARYYTPSGHGNEAQLVELFDDLQHRLGRA